MARWIVDNREATKREIAEVHAGGLNKAAEILLGDANQTTPLEEGVLEASGAVGEASAGNLEAAVGYNTVYAVIQHESVDFNHPGKGRHHWLERTLAEEAEKYQQVVAAEIGSKLR